MERDLDVSLLRAFIAVAETGRMTRAAKIVHITQSAVSQRILRLEALLEMKLFERQSEAARLTKDGERFMSRARRLIALNDEILGEMRGGDFVGEIKFGVPHDVVASVLPPMLRRFRREWPNVLVTLVSSTTTQLRALLDECKLDLALTTERERASRRDSLLFDHLVWVGALGGSAAKRRPLSVALGQEGCAFRASTVDALDKSASTVAAHLPSRQPGTCFRHGRGRYGCRAFPSKDRPGETADFTRQSIAVIAAVSHQPPVPSRAN